LEGAEVAGAKKIAARQGRVIVFIDESGLSERPCRARTWAPRGETPVLQYSFSWKQLSVIAGVSFWRFYFRLHPGTIRTPQVIEFLKALQATIKRKLLIVWDRLQAHRSRLVREHVEAQRGRIALEFLPAYAPEMNPVECIWGYLKHHAMPNFCARDLGELSHHARGRLRSMQRRPTLVRAFWQQAELF
jgi:transposase